jgi:PhnB protein
MTEVPKGRSVPSGDVELAGPLVISVMLIVPDADAATAWCKMAVGATELWNLGGVVGLEIAGAPFFLHEVNPDNPAETVLARRASRVPA